MEGGEQWGWAGASGFADPANFITSGAAALACRMPASWRDDCPHEREGADQQSA
jgi:hypothetical protein